MKNLAVFSVSFISVLLVACESPMILNSDAVSSGIGKLHSNDNKAPNAASFIGLKFKLLGFQENPTYYIGLTDNHEVVFNKDGTLNGVSSCNGYWGRYNLLSRSEIEISQLASTRMGCLTVSESARFLSELQKVRHYKVYPACGKRTLLLYETENLILHLEATVPESTADCTPLGHQTPSASMH